MEPTIEHTKKIWEASYHFLLATLNLCAAIAGGETDNKKVLRRLITHKFLETFIVDFVSNLSKTVKRLVKEIDQCIEKDK